MVADDGFDLLEFATDSDTTASVRVLTRLYDPKLLTLGWILLDMRMLSWVVVRVLELAEFAVRKALLYVIGQGQEIEGFLRRSFIVNLHVVVDGFLITQVVVILHM